ncbi:hypothetical protein [Parapedobacter koreensis]|uniref:hypothetical protein n=1 Tax=Parapedobacter koreensis TaxID=332977 RepID=UPI00115FBE40|nr:hypothetical protein [Parapedobacter koreensis]
MLEELLAGSGSFFEFAICCFDGSRGKCFVKLSFTLLATSCATRFTKEDFPHRLGEIKRVLTPF